MSVRTTGLQGIGAVTVAEAPPKFRTYEASERVPRQSTLNGAPLYRSLRAHWVKKGTRGEGRGFLLFFLNE